MPKSPWFKFYASDYLLDSKVDALPLEAQAILVRMWAVISIDGKIPNDPKIISRLCRIDQNDYQKHHQNLHQMFYEDADGFLHSERMEKEQGNYRRVVEARKFAVECREKKRLTSIDTSKPSSNGSSNGSSKTDQSEIRSQILNTTTPLTPQGGNGNGTDKPSKKRRTRSEMIAPYSEVTKGLVNGLIEIWPETRPGNKSAIHPDVALLASRVDELLQKPNVSESILMGAAKRYLAEEKAYPHSPEFFFGPGKGGEPPWRAYARMEYHEQQKQLSLTATAGRTQ